MIPGKTHSRILFSFFVLSFFPLILPAQSTPTISVEGPFCGESCAFFFLSGAEAQEYHWEVYQIVLDPPNPPIFQFDSSEPYMEWCGFWVPGVYDYIIIIEDENGNTILETPITLFVDDNFFEYEEDAVGTYASTCDSEFITWTYSSFDTLTNPCWEVCVGAVSTISLESLALFGPDGTVFTDASQGYWAVYGVDAEVTQQVGGPNGLPATIEWQEAGTANLVYQYFFQDWNGCPVEGELEFCVEVAPDPEADFSTQPPPNENGILEICEGQTVYFTNETEGNAEYYWDFGDGGTSSEEHPDYTFTEAGTFEVLLAATTTCNCSDTTRLTVIVEGNESPFIDCVATICENQVMTYTANTGCSTYSWNISSNGTIVDGGGSSDDFVVVEWGGGPVGEITLETDGCPDLSTCTEAAYLQVPIVSDDALIDGPDRVCRGEQSVYSITPFEGTEFNWSVSNFGTIIAGQGTPSITVEWFDGFIPGDAQWVAVDYTNCYLGCGGSDQLTVNMRPEFFASGAIEVCENGSSTYSVTNTQTNVGFPANFSVLAADGTPLYSDISGGSSAMIDWTFGPGTFTLRAAPQTIADFCVDSYDIKVTVYPEPAVVSSVSGQVDICPGIGYTYSVDDINAGDRFRWTIDDGGAISVREGNSIAVTWGNTAPYSLSVERISLPLGCSSEPTVVSINAVSGFTVSGDDEVCTDQIGAYTSDQTGDVYYAWSVVPAGAGTITGDPAAANIEVLWHDPGPAQVVLDICGQQEVFDVNVNAPPQPVVDHPAALCPGTTAPVSTMTAFASYSWQDTVGNELSTLAVPDLGPGYYRVEVTDALGCTGFETFSIYGYPESEISISTPDYNIFCNTPPFTRLFAVNTEDGYSYQWYQDGTPVGSNTTQYTATALGTYWVEITDENGCQFTSNSIPVFINCGDGRCSGNSGTCPDHDFTIQETGTCNVRDYTALVAGSEPGTTFWDFDDPASGADNTANGNNVSHTYAEPGFYRVLMGATYDDGNGNLSTCVIIKPDTVLLVANFEYDGVCPGAPVQFYDLSTFLDLTSITAWSWDFGDPSSGADNTSSDKDPMHIFTGQGDYDVTLTVTSATGCTASITQTITIYPLPYTNIPDPTVTCAATALEFVADVEATVSDVVWHFGDPGSGNADTSRLFTSYHAYDATGNYDVELMATSIYGCSNSATKTITITPNDLAGDIDPPGLSMLCEGESLTLTGPQGVATGWAWSTGSDQTAITVEDAGTYEVTVTSDEGCTYTPAAAVVDIIPAPQSPIRAVEYNDFNQPTSYTYDSLFVCEGIDIYLETEQTANYTYSWSSGDMDNTTEFSEDRGNLLPAGEHEVTLTVTDQTTGCSNVEVFVVVVHPNPATPTLDTGGSDLCAGSTTTISIPSIEGNTTYVWSNGDQGQSITTDEAGEYYVTAINTFGCRAESDIVEVFAGPDISLVPSGCHTRCAPDTLCLPTIPDVVSYQWYQDGMLIPDPEGTVPELIVTESGSYTLEMEDINGCVQTSEPLNLELLPGFGNLTGVVLYDLNENMVPDNPDSLAGDIVFLLSDANGLYASDTTDITGTYSFLNVPEGMYTICIDTTYLPEGWWPYVVCQDINIEGCDFMGDGTELIWLLGPHCVEESTFIETSICENSTFPYAGDDLPPGAYQYNFLNSEGCDSTVNLSILPLPVSTGLEMLSGCPGSTVMYDGFELAVGSSTDFTLMAANGCDSVVTVQVEALVTTTGSETLFACPGGTAMYQGQALSIGSSTDFSLVGSNGCDSVVTVQVEAFTTSSSTETLYACTGTTATYEGQALSIGSSTDFTFIGANGCDSVVTVLVEELLEQQVMQVEYVCPGESFTYQGQDYPTGTDEIFSFTNAAGCDSLVQLLVVASPEAEVEWQATESCQDTGTGLLSINALAGNQPFVYALDAGPLQAGADFANLAPGSYQLTVEDALGCQFEQSVSVGMQEALVVDLHDEILPCDSAAIQLQPTVISGDDGQLQFSWNDGPATLARSVTDPGTYELRVSNGCEVIDLLAEVMPEIDGQGNLIYVPNAFSPNNDGMNDEFQAYPGKEVGFDQFRFRVFDRWGAMQFETDDSTLGWSGKFDGRPALNGVYVWQLEATVNLCGREIEVKQEGDVMLIR